jgi:DNA repair exonuclease SbcCD ATPase subunit
LKKIEEKVQELEKKGNATERIAKLRSLGVFIKTYNMAHLLVTRYSVKDTFGTTEELTKLDELETQLKDSKNELAKLQHDKKEENAKQIEALQSKIGKQKDDYQNAFTKSKANIGSKMYTRFMEGFPMTGNAEDKERQFHTQFLFKKLKF